MGKTLLSILVMFGILRPENVLYFDGRLRALESCGSRA